MGKTVRVDLTGVESFQRASEGEHICKIAAADLKQSQGGNDMIVVQFEVTKGNDKGARVYENFPLSEAALWKLKSLLQALGFKCDGKIQLDLDKLIGKVCIVGVVHEEYNGQIRSKADYIKKFAAATDDENESDDDDEDEEQEEEVEQEKPAKKTKKEKAPINPPADEEDDDWDEDDDDEEEEEEKPAPKKEKKTKKEEKPAKKDSKKSKSKDEDEDDDDWDDDDWDE